VDKKTNAAYLDSSSSKLAPRNVFFETMIANIRQVCLDQTHSPLWNLVDRSKFELMTSADTASSERHRNIEVLLDIVTLFELDAVFPFTRAGCNQSTAPVSAVDIVGESIPVL
jgi:hypothetical protein